MTIRGDEQERTHNGGIERLDTGSTAPVDDEEQSRHSPFPTLPPESSAGHGERILRSSSCWSCGLLLTPQEMQQRKLIIVFVIVGVCCVAFSVPMRNYMLQRAREAAANVPSMTPSTTMTKAPSSIL